MWGQTNGHRGWGGWGYGGWFIAPLLLFGAGLFFLFFIFKTGLWIPLLLLALFFWFFSPMSRGWGKGWGRGWNREWSRGWGQRWSEEASKRWQAEGGEGRGWGWNWSCDDAGETADSGEKAKRQTSDTTGSAAAETPKRKPHNPDFV